MIKRIARDYEATIGLMMIVRPNQVPILVTSIPHSETILKEYDDYFHGVDPWNPILLNGVHPANNSFISNLVIADKEYHKTEYFNDFWKRYSLYYSCGGLLKTKNNITIIWGLPRDKLLGPYDESEAILLDFYGRQIVRALELEGVFGESLPNQIYEHSLAKSFGLSSAESRLVLELFKCGSLPQVSKSLNRSYHTVRNQMKSVLRKTETTNQIELFYLLVLSARRK